MDRKLLYSALGLVTIGLIMVYSSSSVMAANRFGSHLFFLQKQIVWLLLSLTAAAFIMKIDLRQYSVYAAMGVFVAIVMLALVFLMPARNGSHRWLFLGPLTIQPSEIFRLMVIVYLAYSLTRKNRDITEFKQFLIPYGPLIGCGLVLIILEPSLGSAITISLTVFVIFFLAGVRLSHLAALIMPVAGLGSFMVLVAGYKKARLIDHLAAIENPLEGSYQVKQAILALGAGGLMGNGLGNGKQKLFFLPYPHTDFIFASIGEEVGFLGLLVILFLYYMVFWRGLKIALSQTDRFGFLLAMGVTASLFVAVLINIGVVTSLLPTTGIPLPLISYGGSALMVSVISVAILLNLSVRKGVGRR